MLGEEEGLEREVCIDGIHLEHVSEFKYSGCVLKETECSRKVARGRRVAGPIRSLVNARSLQRECAGVLYESLQIPFLTYGNETMIWREKERSRIRAVQVDKLKGLLAIRKMGKVPNARTRQLR